MSVEKLLQIIVAPHISEKTSTAMEKRNQYVFKVLPVATKIEIKHAIESLFNTKVAKVRVLNVRPKTKRFRNVEGTRKKWKKAYVTLQPGQQIDLLGGQ
jgi:large subunit ribosomal protein L23